jgi:hypothetical protein
VPQANTDRLELDRDAAQQEHKRLTAEADRLRTLRDDAQAQIVSLQAGIAARREASLTKEIEAAKVNQGAAAPVNSVIIKNLQVNGRVVPGNFTGNVTITVIPPVPPANPPAPAAPVPAAP